ncbi:Rap1a/Tai family immunity protein [Duganella margarita]|uniref:Rap1a/Tai family immunity protein n=1 Tax=Duganella margarita TaxID=2692170 RepID=UPI003530B4FF
MVTTLVWVEKSPQAFTRNDRLAKLKVNDLDALRYLTGVVDAAAISKNYFEVNPMEIPEPSAEIGALGLSLLWGCRPEKATYDQVADVTIKYLSDRPNIRHLDASLLIAFAMKDAWPCKQKQATLSK